jgi:hypothetical protein
VESLNEIGRRGFVGRLAAGSAALVSGMWGLAPEAAAHEERLTMVPAVLGRQWGIFTYRVRRSGYDTETTRVVAELLGPSNQKLGEFARTRRFSIDIEVDTSGTEVHRRKKRFRNSEKLQFAWASETVEIITSQSDGTFRVNYNGQRLGSVRLQSNLTEVSPALSAFTAERSDLLNLAADAGSDLDGALPEAPRTTGKCCCQQACIGLDQSCLAYDFRRSVACQQSESCTGTKCWNSMCIGCCILSPCDCICAADDFFCWCTTSGTSCGCEQYCV